ncbi:MAG: HAMP domain-containing histidine kinase [Bacteroidales bacterium]|nr:HAMP domain-containing histidine kinase [Bacteroidales bacterium]
MKKTKWILLALVVALAAFALFEISHLSRQIRINEQEKVKLWANAITQKAQLVSYSEEFFANVALDEHRKMEMYINILRSFNHMDANADASFSLDYVSYIIDSCETAILITDRDSIITVPNELSGQKLRGELLREFSHNEPFHYRIWGMPLTLYYKESKVYTELRHVLDGINKSFLSEITNNSVNVPVLVVDSLQGEVLGSGNIPEREFNSAERLAQKLCEMEEENDPIEVRLATDSRAYIFYESSPLIKALRWVPLLYLFVALVLALITYHLFRTAHTMQQNRIWVGMAKETAHQLGTPISSLIAWTQYLEGKTFDQTYAAEINKDLQRLETVAHRFGKIGSKPELKPEPVCATIQNAINYLQTRSSRKVKFVTNFPDDDIIVPLNSYLFEWVIENICKNAIDAMDGKGTFTAIVSSDTHHVYIDLADTGKGMSPSIRKRVFDSGFTTKQRGWGLGLSLAKRIIVNYHRGRIFVKYSVEGQGTVFRIVLNRK